MKKIILLITATLIFCFVSQTAFAEPAPQDVIDFAHSTLADYGRDPALVQAVKAENATGKTMGQIQALDEKWMATPGIADFMKPYLENPTAEYLRGIQDKAGFYSEIFLMDNQGGLVATTNKTSDYWQGDETKFNHPFSTGTVHIPEISFDTSTQTYLVQVSVPVFDGDAIIGAITFGIEIDEF